MPVSRDSFAISAEVGVIAHSTLVANAFDVRHVLLVFAQRPITIDTIVPHSRGVGLGKRLVDRYKPMARMNELGALDALRAEVPVRTVEALVAHTIDELLTSIAHGAMAHVPAGVAKNARQWTKRRLTSRTFEDVTRMMAVPISEMAVHAQVVVLAGGASDKALLWENSDARVAGPCRLLGFKLDGLALLGESTGHFLFSFRL